MMACDAGGGDDGETVVVGVKLDAQSKELLTWSMVKVAKPGDRVIALHVMGTEEIMDQDGKSSLFSVVKQFDSVLAVYEGFCNLKQVDLKLKICRGTSISKILIREAKAYNAHKLILGTATRHHTIRSSSSVAKSCARKLAKECTVLAVHNGKVLYKREASLPHSKANNAQGDNENLRNGILSKYNQPISSVSAKESSVDLEKALAKLNSDPKLKQDCCICKPVNNNGSSENSGSKKLDKELVNNGVSNNNSMAMVPVDKPKAADSKSPEKRPGWPLLGKTLVESENQEFSNQSPIQDYLLSQKAIMRLPSADTMDIINSNFSIDGEEETFDQEGESGTIVPFDASIVPAPESEQHHSGGRTLTLLEELENLPKLYSSSCRVFKYEELERATSDFAPENLIGKGGSSKVYRGSLPDGNQLAVKILRPSADIMKEFILEIEIITSLRHRNVTSLFGFCLDDKNLLMVYDFLPRGSLEENLHGSKKGLQGFGWNERYKVAVGVAEAINYLHNLASRSVIHRDVKSSNILLSDDFAPQLSDFGLAQWSSCLSTKAFTDIAGTFGYLAPEYFMYGKVTEKIDVYAYGVVLLELLSGRKPISNDHPKGRESLVMWAKPMLNGGKVTPLLDPALGSNYNLDQMERMVLTANLCIRKSPRARPKMSMVLRIIKGEGEAMRWARMQVNTTDNSDRLHGCREVGEFHLSPSSIQSHLNLALLDVVEDIDSISVSSIEQNVSLEDYLRGRWSRSSSFN